MIYTKLRERAEKASIQQICTEISLGTYFRRGDEMLATDDAWKVKTCGMLACVMADKADALDAELAQ